MSRPVELQVAVNLSKLMGNELLIDAGTLETKVTNEAKYVVFPAKLRLQARQMETLGE